MSEPFDDRTEERLRAILRAEAGSVDPSPEALERIRARTERNRFAFPWLRPLLAVGAAAAIAASVFVGAPQVREQVLQDLFPASGSEQSSQTDPEGGQAAEEPEPSPEPTGPDGAEQPSDEDSPAPQDDDTPNTGESPDDSDMNVTCSTPPPEGGDPTHMAENENENDNSDDSDCAGGEDDSTDDNTGDDGTGDNGGGDTGGPGDGNGDNNGGDDGDNDGGDGPGGGDGGDETTLEPTN